MSKPLQRLVALTCIVIIAAIAVYAIDTLAARGRAREQAQRDTQYDLAKLRREFGLPPK